MGKLELIEGRDGADSQVLLDTEKGKVLKHYFIPETWVSNYIKVQNQVAEIFQAGHEEELGYPLPILDNCNYIERVHLKVVDINENLELGSVDTQLEQMRERNEERVKAMYHSYGILFQSLEGGRRLISEVSYIPGNTLGDLEERVPSYIKDRFNPIQQLVSRVTDILEREASICLTSTSSGFGMPSNSINPINVKYNIQGGTIYLTVTDIAEAVGVLLKHNNLLENSYEGVLFSL